MSFWVKVIRTPEGEAPEEVREAWVGVLVECVYRGPACETGLVSRRHTRLRDVVLAPKEPAIFQLAMSNRDAAQWFINTLGRKAHNGNFAFGEDEVEFLRD